MSTSEIYKTIDNAKKDAMRARDKQRLGTIRMIQAEFKRVEVDERIELDDARVTALLDKMLKQRRDAAQQYRDAGREELADAEEAEIDIIRSFLPKPLTPVEIDALIDAAIAETGADNIRDMGKLMGVLKPKFQGRCDMGEASARIKSRLQD